MAGHSPKREIHLFDHKNKTTIKANGIGDELGRSKQYLSSRVRVGNPVSDKPGTDIIFSMINMGGSGG